LWSHSVSYLSALAWGCFFSFDIDTTVDERRGLSPVKSASSPQTRRASRAGGAHCLVSARRTPKVRDGCEHQARTRTNGIRTSMTCTTCRVRRREGMAQEAMGSGETMRRKKDLIPTLTVFLPSRPSVFLLPMTMKARGHSPIRSMHPCAALLLLMIRMRDILRMRFLRQGSKIDICPLTPPRRSLRSPVEPNSRKTYDLRPSDLYTFLARDLVFLA